MTEKIISMLVGKIQELESQLSTALSLSSAYREALEEIIKKEEWSSRYCSGHPDVIAIARAALEPKPEESVGREVSREELTEEIKPFGNKYTPAWANADRAYKIAGHLLSKYTIRRKP